MLRVDAVVVGAGLTGLRCALELEKAGKSVALLEASDGPGGRVRSDVVDGFTLDRGFQVLLTAYPEAQHVFDYSALALRSFAPGASIRLESGWTRLSDPLRAPQDLISTTMSPAASFSDKLRILALRAQAVGRPWDTQVTEPEVSTEERLRRLGFSPVILERFFRPFLGGIFLDGGLRTSSRMFDFVFRYFTLGLGAVPARGMGALSAQLASRLKPQTLRLRSEVVGLDSGGATLRSGERVEASQVILAVEGPQAGRLLGEDAPSVGSQPVTCVYFAAQEAPRRGPHLYLNGTGRGIVNNACIPSEVSAELAPPGQALVSATVLAARASHDEVRAELAEWFSVAPDGLRHLKTYTIHHALPTMRPGALEPFSRTGKRVRGVLLAGDYMETASIEGALVSGRKAASAALASWA